MTTGSLQGRQPDTQARRRVVWALVALVAALATLPVAPLNLPAAVWAAVAGYRLAFPRTQRYALLGLAVFLIGTVLAVGTILIVAGGLGATPRHTF